MTIILIAGYIGLVIFLMVILLIRYRLTRTVREVENYIGPITRSGKTKINKKILESYGFNIIETKDGAHGIHPYKKIIITEDPKVRDWIIEIRTNLLKWRDRFDFFEDMVEFTIKHGVEVTPKKEDSDEK